MTGDANYGQGLNGNFGYIFRYRETPFSVLAPIAKVNAEDYVSITIGVAVNNTGSITITTPAIFEDRDILPKYSSLGFNDFSLVCILTCPVF